MKTALRLPDLLVDMPVAAQRVGQELQGAAHDMLPMLGGHEGTLAAPIHAASTGSAKIKRVPIVLVPGYLGTPEYLEPLRRSLVADGFVARSFRVPQEGVGDAYRAGHELASFIQDVRRELGGAPVMIAGHSRGGMLALDAAANHLPDGSVVAVEALLSPLNGKHVDPISRRLASSRAADLLVPDRSLEQLLSGSDYVDSLWHNDLSARGVQLVSLFRDKSDGVVRPIDAQVPHPGWENVPVNVASRPGQFQHLRMVTHNRDVYNRVAGHAMTASLRAQ